MNLDSGLFSFIAVWLQPTVELEIFHGFSLKLFAMHFKGDFTRKNWWNKKSPHQKSGAGSHLLKQLTCAIIVAFSAR